MTDDPEVKWTEGVTEPPALEQEMALRSYGVNLDEPDFANAGRVHDWRNYVPDAVKGCWAWLDRTARIAVYLTAQDAADAEEWE